MNIYQTNILDKFDNPLHSGKPDKFTHSHHLQNLTCGDEVTIFLTVIDDIVTDARFAGEGCVISLASAEIVCENLIGKRLDEVLQLTWEDVVELLQIPLTASRIKCAHLSLQAAQEALKSSEGVARSQLSVTS